MNFWRFEERYEKEEFEEIIQKYEKEEFEEISFHNKFSYQIFIV